MQLLRTLEGHVGEVHSIAFDPTGRILVSGGDDYAVKLWDVATGELLRVLTGSRTRILTVAFDPNGRVVAAGNSRGEVWLWSLLGEPPQTLKGHDQAVRSVAFDPAGELLASGGEDGSMNLWRVGTGALTHTFAGRSRVITTVIFDPTGQSVASAGTARIAWANVVSGKSTGVLEQTEGSILCMAFDLRTHMLAAGNSFRTIYLWDERGRLLRRLEGHTEPVDAIAFTAHGRLLVSKGRGGTIRFWNTDTWETVAVIPNPAMTYWTPALAVDDQRSLLAVGADPGVIQLWQFDPNALLKRPARPAAVPSVIHHTTARIVLVGDSGVGKTGLGWRLAEGEYKEHSSTHGQQFWVFKPLSGRRRDGAECEAVLWDLAGQADYRIIHALFLDDADLALVVFDPTDSRDPLRGVEFWLKQLGRGGEKPAVPTILVAARNDRGTATLTEQELEEFCRERGIAGYISTSAKMNDGVDALTEWTKKLIPWDERPVTVTTVAFKQIKDNVLALKEREGVIVSPQQLRQRLQEIDPDREFTDVELSTAVGHLENYGYVKRLRTSRGEEHILLAPDLLNNVAASLVLEARKNPKGLGSLDEKLLQSGQYSFPDLAGLSDADRDTLLDSAALLFLNHNVCFRETDPLRDHAYLVFPELINLKKPRLADDQPTEDGASYIVSGSVENVYSSLVVLLGYTQQFTRTNQWHNHARYEVGDRLVCGFRLEESGDGELDFVLYFGTNVGQPVRTLFQGLFESFLARRNVTVMRYEPLPCPVCKVMVERSVVRDKVRGGHPGMHCTSCGARIVLPKAEAPIQLTREQRRDVEEQQRFASQRSRFEQAVYSLRSYIESRHGRWPSCFISYPRGTTEEEKNVDHWVERNLATDLKKAGVEVVLDVWVNERSGGNIARFIEQIPGCDYVIVVGTPLYVKKYANAGASGTVLAAEADLINQRLLGTEKQKHSVLPALLAGTEDGSFPPLMRTRVFKDFRDFRDESKYLLRAFELMLEIHGISEGDHAVADLVEFLIHGGRELRVT